MKQFFLMLAITVMFALTAQAQFTNLWISTFDVDTLTNSDTGTFQFGKNFDYSSDVTFVVINTEISGTASNLITIEQNASPSGSDWVVTDTVATATASGNFVFSATSNPDVSGEKLLWGYRIRLKGTTSGTGVHSMKVYAIGRRRHI